MPVKGQQENYQDFEFTDAVVNHGYTVNNGANSELELTTDAMARFLGDYGLRVKIEGGDGSVFIETPLGFSNINGRSLYLSFYYFHINSLLGLRVNFLHRFDEPFNVLSLAFGPPTTGWQVGFYNTGHTFSRGEWNFDSIDLMYEAELAVTADNSPWVSFKPNVIESIEFEVSVHSLIKVESCIDEMKLTTELVPAEEGNPGSCIDEADLNQDPSLPIPFSNFWIAPIIFIPIFQKRKK